MKKAFGFTLVSALCFVVSLFHGGISVSPSSRTTTDGSEHWGYVQVRPKAHMFWWLYKSPYRVDDPSKPWPIILWLQGGPGGSGVGIGNFEEIGPLDTDLKPRSSTWLSKADLLFVDNPVGTGYSFVEDTGLFVKTDDEAAEDLTTLLEKLFNGDETLQKSPVFIVAESYGGKFAVTLALSALKAIEDGKLKLKLGGVALGDTWISPEDFVISWGPLLKDVSRIDENGLKASNSVVEKIKQQIKDGHFFDASASWNELEELLMARSNGVDFYNFMSDLKSDSSSSLTTLQLSKPTATKRYTRYLSSSRFLPGGISGDLDTLMNGVIKKKLQIPDSVTWGGQSDQVFSVMGGDFMRPRINEVDQLLAKGVNVTIYNGQVDLICSTKGTEAWVNKLKWEGLELFLSKDRSAMYCNNSRATKGFTRSHKNLHFYWILGAGHFVPVDQPCIALKMVSQIVDSPR